ncbi:hypothetical protein TWF106_006141 [Orbilia oligospora]|uniref:Uncharacterized protein n=1 Tax=Orbilia oligospora TaxID=2813651 RepID=A0A7C8QQ60_ORBOL|nr:hypothetical protein TWF106_006141 [Orbilia oligospora]
MGGNIYIPIPQPDSTTETDLPMSPRMYPASQRFVLATEVLDIQLEPILGHTAWHDNPNFAEVRVPLEAERVGVRGRPGMCYDGKVEMWYDGRKGVGLVRL